MAPTARARRKTHDASVNKAARESLDAYLEAGGLGGNPDSPLWRTMTKERGFSERRMSRVDVFRMIKRRVARCRSRRNAANCDSLRVSGVSSAGPRSRRLKSERQALYRAGRNDERSHNS